MSVLPTSDELKAKLQKLAQEYKTILSDALSDKPKAEKSAGEQMVDATVKAAGETAKETAAKAAEKANIKDGKWSAAGEKSTKKDGETSKSGNSEKDVNTKALDKLGDLANNTLVQMALGYLEKYSPEDILSKKTDIKKVLKMKGADMEAYFQSSAEWKNLVDGLKILVKAGVVISKDFSLKKEYEGKLGKAELVIKATAKAAATADAKADVLNLKEGILIDAKANAQAEVKGSLSITGKHEYTELPWTDVFTEGEIEAFMKANASAAGEISVTKDGVAGEIGLNADASIGFGAKGQVEVKSKAGNSLFKLKGNASVDLGAKATLKAKFAIKKGKLTLGFEMGAAAGFGATVGGEIEINLVEIWKVIKDAIKNGKSKFFTQIRALIEKVKEVAVKVKDSVVKFIDKVVDKVKRIKEWFTSKKDKLNAEKAAKLESKLALAENVTSAYEEKVGAIKDNARVKVVENLNMAEKDLKSIEAWANEVMVGAKLA